MIKRTMLCIAMSTILLATNQQSQLVDNDIKSASFRFDVEFVLADLCFFSNKIDEYIKNRINIPIGTIVHLSNASIDLQKRTFLYLLSVRSIAWNPKYVTSNISNLASPFSDENSDVLNIYNACPHHSEGFILDENYCSDYCKKMSNYLFETQLKIREQIQATKKFLGNMRLMLVLHEYGESSLRAEP